MAYTEGYTQEMADRILEWIADGKTLREFCRQPDTPCFKTVYVWRKANPEFDELFELARDVGFDVIAEEALKIADTPLEGRIETQDGDKLIVRKEDMLGHRKLQIETRLKLLAKWSPRKYGEMMKVAGPDGGPIQTQNVKSADELTDAELEAIARRGRPASAEPPEVSLLTDEQLESIARGGIATPPEPEEGSD